MFHTDFFGQIRILILFGLLIESVSLSTPEVELGAQYYNGLEWESSL